MKKGLIGLAFLAFTTGASAEEVKEGDVTFKDFRFRSGETLAELRIHYRTLGTPQRDAKGSVTNAVMVMHGTGGSGAQFLRPQFAGELFGPGQPLDAAKYYIILPDGIGHGGSSKPSNGLTAKFPHYDYDDMVEAEYRLVTEGLKVDRLRLMMGTSMGCMHSFVMGEAHPDFAEAYMPLACLPVQIAGLNRTWRKMLMDAITADPAWKGGDYETQPIAGLTAAANLMIVAGSAPLRMQLDMPTRDQADANMTKARAAMARSFDANDLLYQVDASRNYDPSKDLAKITVPVMWINSADDFINPPYLGIAEQAVKELTRGTYVLLPATPDTHGHSSHTWAVLWKERLVDLLRASEK